MITRESEERLSELESDAFQLKLRNYYLEQRLNATIADREANEERLKEIAVDSPSHTRTLPSPRVNGQLPSPRVNGHPQLATPSGHYHSAPPNGHHATSHSTSGHQSGHTSVGPPSGHHASHLASGHPSAAAPNGHHESAATHPASSQTSVQSSQIEELSSLNGELRLELAAAKREIEELKAELARTKTAAEDLVAYEAEHIADLQSSNEALTERVRALEKGSNTAQLKRDIDTAFDWLEPTTKVRSLLLESRELTTDPRLKASMDATLRLL